MMPSSGEARQIFASLFVNLLFCSLGAGIGWASSGMKFLESKDSDLSTGALTLQEAGVISSMFSVGGLVGSLIYGYICDKIGRLWALRTIAVPQIISYLLVAFSTNAGMILGSRLLIGFSAGGLFISIPLFVSEITEDMIRGTAGSLFLLLSCTGILLSYILGAFMRYNTCVWVYLAFPCIFLIGSFLLHDTPYYLIKNEKYEKAKDAILFYRGAKTLEGNAEIEFKRLKRFIKKRGDRKEKVSWSDFQTKAARKSIAIGIVLVAMEQFSGCFILLFNAAKIFDMSGATAISPEVATIIIGLIQLLGAYFSTSFVDRLGRRKLYLFSTFGILLGMNVFGISAQLMENGYSSRFLHILPVLGLSLAIFAVNVGVFTMTFILLAEIVPYKVKSHIFTLCMILSWVFSFTVFNVSPLAFDKFGLGGTMYIFAFNAFVGGIFIFVFVPETTGKSLEEIAEIMNK